MTNGTRIALPSTLPLPAGAHQGMGAGSSLWAAPEDQHIDLPLSPQMRFFAGAVTRFAAGGVYLLGGAPGTGKSLLGVQVALDLACHGIGSLLIQTEQSAGATKARARQMTADWKVAQARRAMNLVHVEQGLYDVASLPTFLTREVLSPAGRYHGVRMIVVDSIQGDGLAAGATKAYAKVLEFARLCAGNGITVLLVSHVTKRGDLAGPKTLEHGVDVTLVLRRAMLYSLLAVRKNRFGPTLLRPVPLTVDRRTLRMAETPHAHARPGAAWAYSEVAGLMQVQASVAVPPDGRQGRMTAPGLPRREIEQLVACVGQIEGLELADLDYRIQCRLPGSGQYLTWFGLPLCIALIGSFIRRDVPQGHVYLGEIDLFHAVQPIPPSVLEGLGAAIESGQVPLPVTLFVPPSAVAQLPSLAASGRVRVVPCRTLEDAVRQTWPDLWQTAATV